MQIAWMDLNKGNSGGWFDAIAVFEDMLPENCQIVHCGEVEKTRRHDEGAMWRFCSVTRDPMKEKQSGFGIIIAKTRGACVITVFWPNKEMGRDQDGLGRHIYATVCWIGPARGFGLDCPCICIL